MIRSTYGNKLKIFKTEIPMSIRAAETSASGKSIYAYDKNGKVAQAYKNLTREVLDSEKKRNQHRSDLIR